MSFDFNVTAWAAVVGVTIALGALLKTESMHSSTEATLIRLMTETEAWTQSANRAFLQLFDRIYSAKSPPGSPLPGPASTGMGSS